MCGAAYGLAPRHGTSTLTAALFLEARLGDSQRAQRGGAYWAYIRRDRFTMFALCASRASRNWTSYRPRPVAVTTRPLMPDAKCTLESDLVESISLPPSGPENPILAAALDHAGRGWRIFPIRARSKRPSVVRWPEVATTDPDQIRAWFADCPDLNLGIATGEGSGLVVVDLDGLDAREAIERDHGPLPSTFEVRTRRGSHLYYSVEGPCRSRGGFGGLKVDLQADGKMVVAPPSIHPDTGQRYERLGEHEVAPAPKWLLAAVCVDTSDALLENPRSRRWSCAHGERKFLTQRLLNDRHDWEQDDGVRHADDGTYRKRHVALWRVLMSEVQRGCDDSCIVSTIRNSTLWSKPLSSAPGNPEGWLRDQIAAARRRVSERPAEWVDPRLHMRMVQEHGSKLSAGQCKVLAVIQEEVYKQGEGLYQRRSGWVTMSYARIANGAGITKGAVGKTLDALESKGWLKVRRASRGRGMASRFALDLPQGIDLEEAQRGERDYSTVTRVQYLRGEESSVSSLPAFRHYKPLHWDLHPAMDAFRYRALASCRRTLVFLFEHSDEGFIATKEIARRLDKDPSTIREHLKRLEAVGLLLRNEKRAVKLAPGITSGLRDAAVQLGTDGIGKAQIEKSVEDRQLRKEGQRRYAKRHGIPRRLDPGEADAEWPEVMCYWS